MSRHLHYLLTRLPSLPAIGEQPPIDLPELSAILTLEPEPAARRVIGVLELEGLLYEAMPIRLGLSDPTTTAEDDVDAAVPVLDPTVASRLPEGVRAAWEADSTVVGLDVWVDRVWDAFFAWIHSEAATVGSTLLAEYTDFEVSLRAALAELRLAPERNPAGEHAELLNAWRSAPDALAGERLLDDGRRRFLAARNPYFSATLDEFTAYLLQLRLLLRAWRLAQPAGRKILSEVTAL